jgi:hypothetical protein
MTRNEAYLQGAQACHREGNMDAVSVSWLCFGGVCTEKIFRAPAQFDVVSVVHVIRNVFFGYLL